MISTRFNLVLVTAASITLLGAANIAASCGHCGTSSDSSTTNAAAKAEKHPTMIDTKELAQMIASNTPMVIVDARSGKYDDGRRIADAKQLAADAKDAAIAKALPDKDALIVAYCTNKECPASAKLAARLIALGYTKVHKYPEGIEGWVAAGNSVTSEKAK